MILWVPFFLFGGVNLYTNKLNILKIIHSVCYKIFILKNRSKKNLSSPPKIHCFHDCRTGKYATYTSGQTLILRDCALILYKK